MPHTRSCRRSVSFEALVTKVLQSAYTVHSQGFTVNRPLQDLARDSTAPVCPLILQGVAISHAKFKQITRLHHASPPTEGRRPQAWCRNPLHLSQPILARGTHTCLIALQVRASSIQRQTPSCPSPIRILILTSISIHY